MNTEQLRAEFEAWADNHYYLSELNNIYLDDDYVDPEMQAAWEGYQAGRAAPQSQVKSDRTLFCDLKTDEEKSAFFLSGRGYETGVIAQAIQNDVAMAYHRCSEYRKELEAMKSECDRLKLEARCHAQEARTANATIAEIYQLVSAGAGEPGNWNGAEPVQRKLEALQAECEKLRKELELWTPIHMEVERRAEKMHCLQDRCDFEVTVMYEDYAALQSQVDRGD